MGTASATDIFVGSIGDSADICAQKLVYELRVAGVNAERDILGRSVKAQMKYANKTGARFSMILGEDEVNSAKADLKNMETGETTSVSLTADEVLKLIR